MIWSFVVSDNASQHLGHKIQIALESCMLNKLKCDVNQEIVQVEIFRHSTIRKS